MIRWRKPITSVPADDEANLRAGRPTVKKKISVPHTTAVPRMPTRDTGHSQWFIFPPGVATRCGVQPVFHISARAKSGHTCQPACGYRIRKVPRSPKLVSASGGKRFGRDQAAPGSSVDATDGTKCDWGGVGIPGSAAVRTA